VGCRESEVLRSAGAQHPYRSRAERAPAASLRLECRQKFRVYVVRDANGQALDNEDEARQAKVLTKDEARRIAVNVARLPELVGERDGDG
jgi:hypothetical protein